MSYPLDEAFQEVAFLAMHLHWGREVLLDLSHQERVAWVRQVSELNEQANRGLS